MMDYVDLLKTGTYADCNVIRLFYSSLEDDILINHSQQELMEAGKKVLELLSKYSVDEIIECLNDGTNLIPLINASNIPQFSDINAVDELLPIVEANGGPECTYALIGYFFNHDGKIGAQTKYGENHYKTAMLMGLTKKHAPFYITPLGILYAALEPDIRKDIRTKLFLRIPVIRYAMVFAKNQKVEICDIMRESLSESTVIRRRCNVKHMVNSLVEESDDKVKYEINIKWM